MHPLLGAGNVCVRPIRLTHLFGGRLLHIDASVEGCCTLGSLLGKSSQEEQDGKKGITYALLSASILSGDGVAVGGGSVRESRMKIRFS